MNAVDDIECISANVHTAAAIVVEDNESFMEVAARVEEDISIVAGLKVRGNPKYFYCSWLMSTFSCFLLLPLLFLLF